MTTSLSRNRNQVSEGVKRHFNQWIDSRLPAAKKVTLTQKKIFIFPTKVGFSFAFVQLMMILAGINYENSLIYAVTFLLGSTFIASILHTFNNLSGLTISGVEAHPCFAGELAEVELLLSREGKKCFENIVLKWHASEPVVGDLIYEREKKVKLYIRSKQRGIMNPGRLLVETYYPVGFFRAWTWLDLDLSILVYPKPVPGGKLSAATVSEHDGELLEKHGAEDFTGLISYYPGASLRHVAWKHYARGQGLYLKDFSAYVDRRIWIDWDSFPGLDRESRLCRICFWILEIEKSSDEYGLRLPGIEIQPSKGPSHMARVLKILAMFELDQS